MTDKKQPKVPKGISKEFQAELEEWMNHGIHEAMRNQMSMKLPQSLNESSAAKGKKDPPE